MMDDILKFITITVIVMMIWIGITVYIMKINQTNAYEECPSICEEHGYNGFSSYGHIFPNELVCECSNDNVKIKVGAA